MRIFLNEQAEHQLKLIMAHTGYTNATHCIQSMLTQVNNKLNQTKKLKAHE